MAREKVGMTLPEELVERILAMVPFPYIFKARVLSKSWLARLSPISPQDDDEKKCLAISFQKQVGELSTRWKTFSPVLVGMEDVIAYDRASDHWQRTTSLSFLPENQPGDSRRWQYVQIDGALMVIQRPKGLLYVANVLTKSWKLLPKLPVINRSHVSGLEHLVSYPSLGTYKVIKFHQNETRFLHALIYDPKLCAWSRKMIDLPGYFRVQNRRATFNGLTYWLVGPNGVPMVLMAFNFEEESFKTFQMPRSAIPRHLRWPDWASLVVCDGSLLMVVYDCTYYQRTVTLVKIDVESQRWLELFRRPSPAPLNSKPPNRVGSDGSCIFFVGQASGIEGMVVYDVGKDELSWSPVPAFISQSYFPERHVMWNSPSFEPGLNPFIVV